MSDTSYNIALAGRNAARRTADAARQPRRKADLAELDRLATLMDSRFKLPIIPIRVGLDTIVGLVPGLGDVATLLPAGYIIARGAQLGARKRTLALMMMNAGLDATLGAIPVFGDLFDLFFKANRRNIALLRRDLGGDAHDLEDRSRERAA